MPADAIVTVFRTSALTLASVPATLSGTSTDGDASSAMRRGMPADAIVTLFSAFVLRLDSVAAATSCTRIDGDTQNRDYRRSVTGRCDHDPVLDIRAQVAECVRSSLLHASRRQRKKRDERRNTTCRCNRNPALSSARETKPQDRLPSRSRSVGPERGDAAAPAAATDSSSSRLLLISAS